MMRRGALPAVLFFSRRSAEVGCALVASAGLAGATARMLAACLSAGVAEAAAVLPWGRIAVAARRDQTALLDCLDGPR
jgi:hypothetical protein